MICHKLCRPVVECAAPSPAPFAGPFLHASDSVIAVSYGSSLLARGIPADGSVLPQYSRLFSEIGQIVSG